MKPNIVAAFLPRIGRIILNLTFLLALAAASGKPAVDFVNPIIGTAEHGHVYPGATVPFGMVQLSPDTRDNTWDGCSGYHYSDDSILGFSHNHLTGTGCPDLGNVLLMPTVGALKLTPGARPGEGYRARFSHTDEISRPGYYEVYLPDYQVKVELTATARAGFHRYTFPATTDGHVVVDLQHGIGNTVTEAQLTIEDDHTASGFRRSDGWGGSKVYYFVMEFSRPFDSAGVAQADKDVAGKQTTGKETKGHFDFKTKAGEQILVRVGLSTVSVEGARKNLHAEIPNWNFDAVAKAASNEWEKALGVFTVETPDPNLKQTFYTSLYHTLVAPTLLSDMDGQFRGPDGKVHQTKGYDYYTELSLWDTFRAENPLLTLIQPARVNDFVNTMLEHYRIFGQNTLPVWPEGGMETWCMIGNHAIPVITDAYLKGFRNYDANEALNDMIASTDKNREQLESYRGQGFIPTGKGVQSVSKVLEYAYDDACIARLAKALGKNDLAEKYAKRSQNWENVFDPSTGFMRGKNADGSWVTPFGEKEMNSINFDEYTEANAWQYNFFVLHNVPGLIAKLGGDDKFTARLDEMFDTKETIPNLGSIPDVTGVIGMYAHGNEPVHHVAYLYNYAGQPWKTQTRVRQVANTLYTNTPGGICGNDDCGQMSAWYVFTALGFYPVDPASGIYILGSPLFDKVTLKLDSKFAKGRAFTVVAKNNSAQNPYIQSATLNGRPITRSWIANDEITAGGKLVLTMGPTPNKNFGSGRRPTDRNLSRRTLPVNMKTGKYILGVATGFFLLSGRVVHADTPVVTNAPAIDRAVSSGDFSIRTTDGKCTITINSTRAPGLTEWAEQKLAPVLAEWYPKIVAMLPSDGYTAPAHFSIILKPMDGVAYTTGNKVTANSTWLETEIGREAIGSLVHETVHVVQQFGNHGRQNPGWLVEGSADYIRWFKYEPQSHGADVVWLRTFRPPSLHYNDSYRITANFLNWVTENYDADIVGQLNAAMREGKYDDGLWKKFTGKTAPELGEEWKKEIEAQLNNAGASGKVN